MEKTKKLPAQSTLILIGAAAGVVGGFILGPNGAKLKFLGDIFVNMVMMAIVPLVMSAIALSFAQNRGGNTGKMAFHTFKYIIIFTIVSALIGVAIGLVIKPGAGYVIDANATVNGEASSPDLIKTLVSFIPSNITNAMAGGNMVQCIVFSIFGGIAAGKFADQSGDDSIIKLIKGVNGMCMQIINMVLYVAPFGIFGLLCNSVGTAGVAVLASAGKFLLCLAIGDAIQFILYFPIACARLGINPAKMPGKLARISLMAVTTTSSSVCLPAKMEDMVTKFGVSRKVSDFTGPITANMNSCGAVNCYVIVILFAAQAVGVKLQPTQFALCIAISAMMCMGTITVPGGVIGTLSTLVATMGLPIESIAIIIAIDTFSGMFRTLMNVDVDVLVGMLVANDIGEFDRDVYNDKKTVTYDAA